MHSLLRRSRGLVIIIGVSVFRVITIDPWVLPTFRTEKTAGGQRAEEVRVQGRQGEDRREKGQGGGSDRSYREEQ